MKRIIFGVVALIFGYFVFVFLVSGYAKWFFSGMYKIEFANIEQKMDKDGVFHVHEIITFEMKEPFRGVYREVPQSRAVNIENVKLWIENFEGEWVEFLEKNSKGFKARVWISKAPISPEKMKRVVLHVKYDAKYVYEKGKDVSQVFRKFWGEDWNSPVENLVARFIFPKNVRLLKVYSHPKLNVQKKGNEYIFSAKNIPPNTFLEARFLMEKIPVKYQYENPMLTLKSAEEIENDFTKKYVFSIFLPPITFAVVVVLLFLVFNFFGKEKKVSYQGVYEREIPYPDTPDIVNAIVINQLGKIDENGINAVIMDLYRKGFLNLDKKGYIEVLEKEGNLNSTEGYFYQFLKKYSRDGIFSFSDLKKALSRDKKLAKEFLDDFKVYKTLVLDEARSRNYLSVKGTYISYVIGITSVIASFLYFLVFFKQNFLYQFIFSGLLFLAGGITFILPRDVFGSWSKEGREYYLKWINFMKFLEDYSALSMYPPESVILWEDYLVYATALGIADKVEKHLKKVAPKEFEESRLYYYPYMGFGRQFVVMSTVATSAVSASSSNTFSGGAGGVGGGSGGGGGGAF
ncbi:hypothetical protein XJ44_04785 [Thermosipho affectus]|uniref:DUF2207 domain-containing protein n=1 Tax=Thermosipho affectus TaxID=660294 RepID=A0ABX3IH07_9BACT|nr:MULTISPECIES: DUF2207 domain-containing protein [Thermosipho]ONN27111.1 hypothetical protein XJ44_04785 [Thermosipho affectus]OOC43448.1 hypothetical protein XO08_04690 [Thermosipho sp. 1074]